jgi:gas vesicle protein
VAVRTEPTSRRTSVLVGAFIGLLLGMVAALLWDPVSGRLATRNATT